MLIAKCHNLQHALFLHHHNYLFVCLVAITTKKQKQKQNSTHSTIRLLMQNVTQDEYRLKCIVTEMSEYYIEKAEGKGKET